MAGRSKRETSRKRMQRQFEEIIDSLQVGDLQKRFLHDRWLEQLMWFETKADVNQRRFYALRLVIIVGGLIVPALVSLNVRDPDALSALAWTTFGLSLVVATGAALDGFFRPGERWRSFRRVAELLKAHAWQYFELAGPYQTADHASAFTTFAAQVEALIQEDLKAFIARATQVKLSEQRTGETPAEDPKAGQ